MKCSHPPILATKLLERLVSGAHREALAGDLVEQYCQDRSGAWYWRQVLFAIVVGIAKDIRDHKLLAACSVAIGLTIYLSSAFPVNWLARWLTAHGMVTWLYNWLLGRGHDSLAFLYGQLFPNRFLAYIACAVSGRIVARIRPCLGLALVCAYGTAVLLFESVHLSVGFIVTQGRHPMASHVLISTFLLIGRPLSILIGGLSALPERVPS